VVPSVAARAIATRAHRVGARRVRTPACAGAAGARETLERFEEIAKALRFVSVSPEATRRAVALGRVSDADAIIAAQALVKEPFS